METVFMGATLCEISSSRLNACEDHKNPAAAAATPVCSFTAPESKVFLHRTHNVCVVYSDMFFCMNLELAEHW